MRDTIVVAFMAVLLALPFTAGLTGGADPDYTFQGRQLVAPVEVAPGVDCEMLAALDGTWEYAEGVRSLSRVAVRENSLYLESGKRGSRMRVGVRADGWEMMRPESLSPIRRVGWCAGRRC